MKRLLALALGILLGCSESPKNEEGHHVADKTPEGYAVRMNAGAEEIHFRYIEVDGHEYLLMTGFHKGGIGHSPKCPCLNKK